MRDEFGRFVKGHIVPKEWLDSSSQLMKSQWKDKNSRFNSVETRRKYRIARVGAGNPAWVGGTETYHRRIARKVAGIYGKTNYKREKSDGLNLIVHHKDGDYTNNSPDNLQVLTRAEHTKLHWKQGDIRGE